MGIAVYNKHKELTVGLIATLLEHCTDFIEGMCFNLVEAWIF